ncbi:MAG: amidohydrolase family protein [Chloroflexota bacterium]
MTLVGRPLIDIHTHIGHLPGVVGEVFAAEDLAYIAAHEGVHFMLASSATTSLVGRAQGLTEALAMTQRYGDRLGAMLWVNPHDPAWEQDVAIAKAHGFYGIKLHPTLDHYEVTRAALDAVFACARAQVWPILTHTPVDGTTQSAACYEPLIRAYPDVVLVLAHLRLGSIPLAKRYANVYVDTTYMDPITVEVGVDALGPTKILFGSDACEGFDVGHPVGRVRPPRSYAGLIQGLRERGLSEAALDTILYANALRLFGIRPA